MVRLIFRFSAITLLLTAVVTLAAISVDRYHAPNFTGGDISVVTTSPERGMTRMQFTNPRISQENVTVENQRFTDLWIEGESHTTESGLPALPVVNRLIGVPGQGAVQLRVLATDYTEVPGYQVYPFQTMEDPTDSESGAATPFRWNQDFYRQNTWYPAEVASLGEPAVLRDVRIVTVSVHPVQYNPSTGMVRIYQNIDVQVETTPGPTTNEKTRTFSHPSSLFMNMYRQLENFRYLGLDSEPPEPPGTYLIICANNAAPIGYAQQIAQWKQRRGIPVRIANRSQTGDSYSQIKNYIQTAYNTWDPPLEYVLLLGDDTNNASDPYHVPSTGGYGGSDYPYTELEGNDLLGDIVIGRFSAENSTMMNLLVTKTLRYEQNPYTSGPDWFSRAYLLAGIWGNLTSNVQTMQYIRHHMYQQGMTDVLLETHNGTVSSAQIQPPLNQGRSFFLWRGAYISEMSNTVMNGISNGWMMPFVFVITCGTGNFAGAGAGLSEAWVRYGSQNNGNGAVACVGTATSGTYTRFNNIIASGIGHGFFVQGDVQAGVALLDSKFQLYRSYYPQNSVEVNEFANWNNLMGDPELRIWTQSPMQFSVSYPSEIPLGANRVPVLVRDEQGNPVADALVCLMKGDETWSRACTDESGYLEMPVTPETTGALWLTVSKTNYLNFTADIAVSQQDFWVGVSGTTVDDDNVGGTSGNNDGQLNPGEIVDITITARNFGNVQTASDVLGTMFSFNNSQSQVLSSEATYSSMAPGAESQSQPAYRVSVPLSAQDEDVTPLLLQFEASGELDTSLTSLTVVSGDASYLGCQFLLSNNRLDPGETEQMAVAVRNVGHRTVTNVQGHLFCSDTLIYFPEPNANFGTITMGGNSTNNGDPFLVTANALTIRGHQVSLGLALSGDDGFRDTLFVPIRVGSPLTTDPTGPDNYGYYCLDNTDTNFPIAPVYTWIETDPGHGGSGTTLPLDDNWEGGDDNVVQALPFTFRMYGVDYDSITVCSNGWAAMGNQREFTDFRNYAIPGAQGPDAMLAAFWDDLVVGTGHVCWQYRPSDGILVIEWSGARTWGSSTTEIFEIILYDPAAYPTPTGDGLIKYQYLNVTNTWGAGEDNDYATVGIESPSQLDGLQVSYWNNYASGAAALASGRAYLFLPGLDYGVGVLQGQVTDAETGNPLQFAYVSVDAGAVGDTTDALGNYSIPNLIVGSHSVACSRTGYNGGNATVTITASQTTQQDFDLTHSQFQIDVTNVQEELAQGETMTVTFHLQNQGNGALTYRVGYDVPGVAMLNSMSGNAHRRSSRPVRTFEDTDDPWSRLLLFDASSATSDRLIQGAAYAWGEFWVSGGGTSPSSPNYFYKFDNQGNYIGEIPQPTTSQLGFHDLAWDGQYLWGSDSQYLVAIDQTGAAVDSIEGVLSPNRALAYDPDEDAFYTANITAPIVVVDRSGNELRQYSDHNLVIYGMTWFRHDPDGYPLYLFCQEGDQTRLQVNKLDPATGDLRLVADLEGNVGDLAGGAEISPSWDSQNLTMVGQIMGATNDQVGAWELAPNTAWINVSPAMATLGPGASQTIELLLDAREVTGSQYNVNVVFNHNASSVSDTLPVHLDISGQGIAPQTKLTPYEYALDQNYPNPFNPTTSIPYSIREASSVTLILYNVLGQKVATLVDRRLEAGQYRAVFDASHLASGIYFYRLEAGSFTKIRKMILLK